MRDYEEYEGFAKSDVDRSQLYDKKMSRRTESLFKETIQHTSAKNYTPVYTLRDYERDGLPSAYLIYMSSVDEREAALKIVGSLAHWRRLCALKWFLEGRAGTQFEGLRQWRKDMADRDASEAKRVLLKQCSADSVAAARALESSIKDTRKAQALVSTPNKKRSSNTEDSNIADILQLDRKGL
jgi:hypothetical protein